MAKASKSKSLGTRNVLFYGDNLEILQQHVADESVDLVYADPPFKSQRNYNVLFTERGGGEPQAQIEAFEDTWVWTDESQLNYDALVKGGAPEKVADCLEAMKRLLGAVDLMAYLVAMAPRLVQFRRVMKSTASLYLHCDPAASHYLKVLLDAVFGPKNFRNEIIWRRTGSHGSLKTYGPIHDTILFYTKSSTYHFRVQRRPYTRQHVENRHNGSFNW